MKANVQIIRKQRVYSLDFKKSIVSLFEKGEYSVLQIEQLYGINNSIVYKWIYKYSVFNEKGVRIVEMKDSNQHKVKELQTRLKELELLVGQKQIMIDYLEKIIDLAKEELSIDIKKNYNSLPLFGSKKTGKS